jgi:hypothetical protein
MSTALINSALADHWEWNPHASAALEYNDNRQLRPVNQESVSGTLLDAGVTLRRETPLSNISLSPRWRRANYSDDDLDSSVGILDGMVERDLERGSLSVGVNYTRDTTLTSELDSSGLVQVNKRRETWNVDPEIIYQLSARSILAVNGSYSDVSYKDALSAGLVDYDYQSVSLALVRELAAKSVITASVYATRLDVTDFESQTDSYGIRINYDHEWSAATQLSLGIGTRRTDYYRSFFGGLVTIDEEEKGYLANASLAHQEHRFSWNVELSRSVSPSGVGVLQQSDTLTASVNKPLNQVLIASASIRGSQFEELTGGSTTNKRDYATGSANLSWILAPEWSINGSYRYTWQKYENATADAHSSAVYLTLHYRATPDFMYW